MSATTTDRPILEVRDLRVRIAAPGRTVEAVRGIDFDLAPGDALAIVGESGCGKSTALRAVAGLLPRRATATGSVLYDGVELLDAPESARRRIRGRGIAMIFQDPMTALDPVIRVGDQVAEGARQVLGLSAQAARVHAVELLRTMGIPDPERRSLAYPHELSGGLRQRVMIASALALEPQVLLCDEPTTALDVTIQDQILALLGRIRTERGVALVYVTHDLAVVAQTCDRLAVMYAGEFVETGSVVEVFARPRHPYTRGLLASVPDFEAGRKRLPEPIPGSPPDLAAPPPGCAFHPRCPWADAACVSGAFPLRALAPGRATACIHADRLPVEAVA
jgi:peptide/nickel transport system ATP-binding protein/oligopeptide transport system ATP-binding protein